MKRRELLTLGAAAALVPLAAESAPKASWYLHTPKERFWALYGYHPDEASWYLSTPFGRDWKLSDLELHRRKTDIHEIIDELSVLFTLVMLRGNEHPEDLAITWYWEDAQKDFCVPVLATRHLIAVNWRVLDVINRSAISL